MSIGCRRFLTDRGVPAATAAVSVVTILALLAAGMFAAQETMVDWWVLVAVLAPLSATILLSRTLAGTDVVLERSTPRLTRGRRAVHVSVALVSCCLLLAVAGAGALDATATFAMLRNTLGFLGMILLAATVVRTRIAWLPALGYTFLTMTTAPRTAEWGSAWWAWIVQPGHPNVSWAVAAVLLVAGATAYAGRGPAA